MKLDNASSTPYGIFMLGAEYLEAAWSIYTVGAGFTQAPARLLAHHSCVLFMKAYLRSRGMLAQELDEIGHDLERLQQSAVAQGWERPRGILKGFESLLSANEYGQLRYAGGKLSTRNRTENALKVAETVRDKVQDELGFLLPSQVPSEHWTTCIPPDFPI